MIMPEKLLEEFLLVAELTVLAENYEVAHSWASKLLDDANETLVDYDIRDQ